MDVKKANEILQGRKDAELAEVEARKVIEEDRIKKIREKAEAEKERKKEEFEAEKKKYPKKAGEIYMLCWNCKNKKVNMSKGEYISKASMAGIIIVGECLKCGSYNLAMVPANNPNISPHDRFFGGIDLR